MISKRDKLIKQLDKAAELGMPAPASVLLELARQDMDEKLQAADTPIQPEDLPIYSLTQPGAVPAPEVEGLVLTSVGWQKPQLRVHSGGGGGSGVGPPGPPGPQGPQGIQGPPGVDGLDGTNGTDGIDGTNGTNGIDGANGTNGIDGREVLLQAGATYIQWQYTGDVSWTNLIAISAITGPAGADGIDGTNGTNGVDGTNGTNGIDGAPGPNLVSTTTTTNITGILMGDGATVLAAIPGTDYQAPGNYITSLTTDVTASGPGAAVATIANSAVTLAKMADMATASLIYRKTAGNGAPEVNTLATLKTDLGSMPAVAHNLLSTIHGDTLADGVARGDVLYGNPTPAWARLAFPASPIGKVLQATATDIAWSSNPLTIGAAASVAGTNTGDQVIREVLTASRTYYVRTDGHDTASGLNDTSNATTGAFLTIQHAVDIVSTLDISTYVVTIKVADGTYTEAVILKTCTGGLSLGSVIIEGNTATPANVIVTHSGYCFLADNIPTIWVLKGFKTIVTAGVGNACVQASNGSIIWLYNWDFNSSTGSHIVVGADSELVMYSNFSISGGAISFAYCYNGGVLFCRNFTATLSNTPAFTTAFLYGKNNALFYADGMTFAGTGATGSRFSLISGSVIYTNNDVAGINGYLPGNANGTLGAGCGYDNYEQVGGSSGYAGFFGTDPIVKPTALTQTYSTADATLAALTGIGVTNNAAGSGSTVADPESSYTRATQRNNFYALADQLNKLTADHADLAQFVNSLVDKVQALGLVG